SLGQFRIAGDVASAMQNAEQSESVILARVSVDQEIWIDDGNANVASETRARRAGLRQVGQAFNCRAEAATIIFSDTCAGFSREVIDDFGGIGLGAVREDEARHGERSFFSLLSSHLK